MILKSIAFSIPLAVVLAAVILSFYAMEDIKVWDRTTYPGILSCPAGTQPYAAYIGAPMSASLDIECFDPTQAQLPVGKQ